MGEHSPIIIFILVLFNLFILWLVISSMFATKSMSKALRSSIFWNYDKLPPSKRASALESAGFKEKAIETALIGLANAREMKTHCQEQKENEGIVSLENEMDACRLILTSLEHPIPSKLK